MRSLDDWISRGHERDVREQETPSPGPHRFSVPTRKEITMLYGTAQQAPKIHQIRDQLEALNSDRPLQPCPHGIDMAAAACGTCMEEDEAKGAWLEALEGR